MKIGQILIYLLKLINSYMKKNLRSACLLFLVFLFHLRICKPWKCRRRC